MNARYFITLVLLVSTSVWGQNIHFLKSFGNTGYDYGRDIKQTPDTGYIATGSSSSFTSANADAFLLKIDSLGNFQWSRNYGGPDSDWGNSVVVTHDSSYAIGGYTNSFGAGGFDFYLVRTDITGYPVWEKTYGGSNWDKATALAENVQDSGFVLVGETSSYGSGNKDIYIVRTDKNGDTLWTKTYGGPENDWATGVLIDGDSVVVCGGTESYGAGMADGIILKMGLNGNIGWTKVVGKSRDDYFTSIVKHAFYYCLGGTKSYTYLTDLNDFWVYEIYANGTIVMGDTTWDGDQFGHDIANDVVVVPTTQQIFYGGSTTSWGSSDVSAGVTDCFISKLSPGYSWLPYVQNFGDIGSDAIYAMDYCFDKGLVAIGDLDKYSTGGNNVLILKNDAANSFGFITVFEDVVFDNITLSVEEENAADHGIIVYPNPAKSILNITSSLPYDSIQIMNISGEVVYSATGVSPEISVEHLSNGVYFLVISSPDFRYTFRVVKSDSY